MGFTTGLLGGLTLTTTVVYLTMAAHRTNRCQQALLLRQQSLVLNHIVDPLPPALPPTNREVPAGLLETAKDRWNKEVEEEWRRLLAVDWRVVRERAEEVSGALWRRISTSIQEKAN